ncbi:DNA repair protein RecN [Zhaonella formicivorans]|uniref:DNA repair protein RecN n=1 Tax=Zhaonella formicivorans TaxID=2528593 RepID=UPI001D12C293|nr:DNA repair protein RecN [Zhaonella formicivorans]
MLRQLNITNFALIDALSVDLTPGFNVLTGETGAGKSIIVDAIGILIGGRASGDFIREGQDKAVIEGFFEINDDELAARLADLGFTCEDESLMLTREIVKSGKNICRINGRMVPLSLYQEVGKELIDIHGQNQEQSLLSPARQLKLLDSFGGQQLLTQKNIVAEKYGIIQEKKKKLAELRGGTEDKETRLEILRYQIEEISKADLKPGEEEELAQEKKILANAEKLAAGANKIYSVIFGGEREYRPVYDLLGLVLSELESLADLDPALGEIKSGIESITYQLEEYAREIRKYGDKIEYDPGRLEQIEQRIDEIKRIKRKYGNSVEAVLQQLEQNKAQLAKLEQSTELIAELEAELAEQERSLLEECMVLSNLRLATARLLEEAIGKALRELELQNSIFTIELSAIDKPLASGTDYVEFLFSPNPGEGLKPLAKIASGGEISRVMLAFKSVLAEVDALPTMIFDEIDTGVGGKAILSLGLKLARLAEHHQVLCVTHSPQVASFADTHFYIYKEIVKNRTKTRIQKLNYEERVLELGRMLGGADRLESALEHAKEMLNFALKEKCV